MHISLMAIDLFRNEILKFLSNTNPEVLLISGRWGVGKTYAWRRFLGEAKQEGGIGLSRYA